MMEGPRTYYPTMVCELYANYTVTLDRNGKPPKEVLDVLDQVLVREVNVQIDATTINQILFGPTYTAPLRMTKFDHRMTLDLTSGRGSCRL